MESHPTFGLLDALGECTFASERNELRTTKKMMVDEAVGRNINVLMTSPKASDITDALGLLLTSS